MISEAQAHKYCREPLDKIEGSAAVKKAEQLEVAAYCEYKAAGGPLKWSAWRHFYKTKKEDQCVV